MSDWRYNAACRDVDSELFFPVGTRGPALRQTQQAKAMCKPCPVRETCLAWALEFKQDTGVWGGLAENERDRAVRTGREPQPCERCELLMVPGTAKATRCSVCLRSGSRPQPKSADRVALPAPTRASAHHDVIAEMMARTPRPGFAEIALAIGSTRDSVKGYWAWHLARQSRAVGSVAS